jgi:hypothetical protein
VRRPAKPATVRFYFDADVLGLAKALAPLRNDITYPGDPGDIVHRRQRPACPITSPATLDEDWIPVVAAQGWLIVTRDSRIQDHPAEIEAVRSNGARMVALSGKEAIDTWAQLEIVMTQWRAIEAALQEPAPLIYAATRTRMRPVDLD